MLDAAIYTQAAARLQGIQTRLLTVPTEVAGVSGDSVLRGGAFTRTVEDLLSDSEGDIRSANVTLTQMQALLQAKAATAALAASTGGVLGLVL